MTAIKSLTLVDVMTGVPSAKYNPFVNGLTIDMDDPAVANLVVKAEVDSTTNSIAWYYDGIRGKITNNNPVYLRPSTGWKVGPLSIGAIPFSMSSGLGTQGIPMSVAFNLKSSSVLHKERGMWVWNTISILGNLSAIDELVKTCKAGGVTDLFIFLVSVQFEMNKTSIRMLVSTLSKAGIKSWSMDGWRGYFADAYGRQQYLYGLDSLIAYNKTAADDEKFVGFHADMEPNDGQGAEFRNAFHNAFKDSQLSTTPGSGVWKSTQAQDRDFLMQDWLSIFIDSQVLLGSIGLKFGAAMPSWVGDFYGEPVHVTYNGTRQELMPLLMKTLDAYNIMSYNTEPSNVVLKMNAALKYADAHVNVNGIKIFAGLDCFPGGGSTESYADTFGKNFKSVMLADIAKINEALGVHPSYAGCNIHDYTGWKGLQ